MSRHLLQHVEHVYADKRVETKSQNEIETYIER